MKYFAIAMVIMVSSGMEPSRLMGEERVATAELPAALQSLTGGRSAVVTREAAERVRGEFIPTIGMRFAVQGGGVYNGSQIVYNFQAGGQSVAIGFGPNGLAFNATGLAVMGTAPPVQGIMAGNTNVFQGTIAFQGNTSNLQVVAYPNQFTVIVP